MPRVMVTGARGFVGQRMMEAIPGAMAAPSLRDADRDRIERMLDRFQPDVIVHTAAISDIRTCEENPEASYRANVLLPVLLAETARQAKLIVYSSDQVYTGCKGDGPYTETDACAPVNLYGRHKLEMEARVLDRDPDAVLLRAEWMFDMVAYGGVRRGNYLLNTLRAAIAGQPLPYSDGQYRGLTYVREVAENTPRLFTVPGGVYNFGSENPLSMYETTRALLQMLGADIGLLRKSPGRGNLWMDCGKLTALGISFLPTAEALRRCLSDYGWQSER